MEAEAPPQPRLCQNCQQADADWKCIECLGRPTTCAQCCREAHLRSPLHRVLKWTGTHFTSAWLAEIGVKIHLGHGGLPCPDSMSSTKAGKRKAPPTDFDHDTPSNSDWESEDEDDLPATDHMLGGPSVTPKSKHLVTIVDRSGVHQLPVEWCQCPSALQIDIQMMDMGLFPATFRRIKTCFTFQVLEDLRIDNIECKTSVMSFYNKLRRVTSGAFPHTVPVRDPIFIAKISTY